VALRLEIKWSEFKADYSPLLLRFEIPYNLPSPPSVRLNVLISYTGRLFLWVTFDVNDFGHHIFAEPSSGDMNKGLITVFSSKSSVTYKFASVIGNSGFPTRCDIMGFVTRKRHTGSRL
jgi:hypothetical protein